jgi:hypothetical protein
MLSATPPFFPQSCGNTSPPWEGAFSSFFHTKKEERKGGDGKARGKMRRSGRAFSGKPKKPCSGEEVRGVPHTSDLLSRSSLGWTGGDGSLEKDPAIISRKRKRMPSSSPFPGNSLSTACFPLSPKTDCVSERGEASDEEDTELTAPYPSSPLSIGKKLRGIRFPSEPQPILSPTREASSDLTEEASTDIERNKKQTEEEGDLLDRAIDHIPSYDDPYYLYLMVVSGEDDHTAQKTLTHIGKSRQPIRCVDLHNKRLLPSKLTQSAAGTWELEMVVGPVGDRRRALALKRLWSSATRGPVTRRQFGKFLATELGVPCYDRSLGKEKTYTTAWTESRIERRRARRASKAASRTTLRRHKAPLFC